MRHSIPLMLALLILAGLPTAVLATTPASRTVVADLDGVAISAPEIPDHFCHDRDFPKIHCFAQGKALVEALLADDAAHLDSGPGGAAAASSGDYVVIYSGLSYSGTYMFVSQNYDTLFVVNWNDRIRSYRSLNGASGTFWTDWYRTGYDLNFCCGASATWLSSRFDQQITSVYRN